MPTAGTLEVTIKINALPADVTTDANGWKLIVHDCDGVRVAVKVRPKMWNKLEQGAAAWPAWVAAIAGKVGERTAEGFTLAEPNIQVFERKVKPDAGAAPPVAG